ncbi:MAG: hypothetical protein GY786_14745, partial [Proteobacteria bacterium]|nr:hypothetical protein [Pseudomonadota bacterium]
MKKRKLLLGAILILASCSDTEKDTAEPPVNVSTVLFDFDGISTGTTGFTSYTDVDGAGGSTITFTTTQGGANRVGELTYSLDQAGYEWSPFVNLEVKLNDGDSYDASEYEGISYIYRGDAHAFVFEIAEVADYGHYRYDVPQSSDWDTVEINFKRDLKQTDWATVVPFSAENLRTLSWRITGTTGDAGSIQFDDVTLLESVERELNYDME